MTSTFEVLAEPNRRLILDLLRDAERPVSDLVELMDVSQPAVSKHLRVLRQAGMVASRVEAQRRMYRICPEPLADVDAWLGSFRHMWESNLTALEQHLDTMDDEPGE
jgi:DNA-binding transcriptional ArsR family regulator